MGDSQQLLKSILGERGYETLEKAIYKQRTQAVLDPLEFYLPLIVVPRTILSWLIQTIKPMKLGEIKDTTFPGRPEIAMHIEKQDIDQYRMEFVSGGRILHSFEKQSLPAASGHLMTVGELYDSFGDKEKSHDDFVNEERAIDPKLDKPKEAFHAVHQMMSIADVKPVEDPESVKWTMSHANIREMTTVIGKLVDALVAKKVSSDKLESELDKVAECETTSNERDLMTNTKPVPKKNPVGTARVDTTHPETPFKKEAIKTNEIVTDNEVSGRRQEPVGSKPKKDPVGVARADEPRNQTPFKPGKAEASQKPETPFKKEAIKTNEIVTDNAVSGHRQKPVGSQPKKDPVGVARTDEPSSQTPFKPGTASAEHKPETPFKKEDTAMVEQREDTPVHNVPSSQSYFRKKIEMLTKPYVSQAQRGKFHAMENRGEISHATVEHWDKASAGKKLPEHVHKDQMDPSVANAVADKIKDADSIKLKIKKDELADRKRQSYANATPHKPDALAERKKQSYANAPKVLAAVKKDEIAEKAEAPKGAGMPNAPSVPKVPKAPVPPSNAPAAAAAKQSQAAGKGIVKPPKMAGGPKMPNPMAPPKMPKAPAMGKSDSYFRSKLGKSEVLHSHATEEQLYKSVCQNCGVPEFVRGDDGNPKYHPCACFLITKKNEEGKPVRFVRLLRKTDGSFGLEFEKNADPETVKLFLLTLKSRLLIKKKHGL